MTVVRGVQWLESRGWNQGEEIRKLLRRLPDGHSLRHRRRADAHLGPHLILFPILFLFQTVGASRESTRRETVLVLILVVDAGLAMQEAAFLDRAASLMNQACRTDVAVADAVAVGRRGQVRDVLRVGMLRPDLRHACVRGFSCFRQGVVAGVEIFALLEVWVGLVLVECGGAKGL